MIYYNILFIYFSILFIYDPTIRPYPLKSILHRISILKTLAWIMQKKIQHCATWFQTEPDPNLQGQLFFIFFLVCNHLWPLPSMVYPYKLGTRSHTMNILKCITTYFMFSHKLVMAFLGIWNYAIPSRSIVNYVIISCIN